MILGWLLVTAIFPAVVLAVMLQPGAASALVRRPVDDDKEPALEPVQLAALQLSVLPSVEDDALDELMKRKTF